MTTNVCRVNQKKERKEKSKKKTNYSEWNYGSSYCWIKDQCGPCDMSTQYLEFQSDINTPHEICLEFDLKDFSK